MKCLRVCKIDFSHAASRKLDYNLSSIQYKIQEFDFKNITKTIPIPFHKIYVLRMCIYYR